MHPNHGVEDDGFRVHISGTSTVTAREMWELLKESQDHLGVLATRRENYREPLQQRTLTWLSTYEIYGNYRELHLMEIKALDDSHRIIFGIMEQLYVGSSLF